MQNKFSNFLANECRPTLWAVLYEMAFIFFLYVVCVCYGLVFVHARTLLLTTD